MTVSGVTEPSVWADSRPAVSICVHMALRADSAISVKDAVALAESSLPQMFVNFRGRLDGQATYWMGSLCTDVRGRRTGTDRRRGHFDGQPHQWTGQRDAPTHLVDEPRGNQLHGQRW